MRTDSVLTYIPVDRRHSLATGIPLERSVVGSVLFADISGFTPLTESLARALGSRRGAEELTRQLNLVYDALTAEVDRYAGTIISFSGDAMTCYFDGGAAPERGALRALTCAFALQTAMSAFERVALPNGATIRLSIKVAVASGSARRFLVGDPSILLMDILAGETVGRISEADGQTGKGEVVIDQATADLIPGAYSVGEWRTGETTRFARITSLTHSADPAPWSPVDPETLSADQVRAWVLKSLHERGDDSLTELRPAVAIFVSFSGIDYDNDPDSERKLDVFVRWIQAIITRYDGALIQFTMGDKGSYCYAAFGAPTSHENNAARAASAALDIRNPPPELNYVRINGIGIAQGIMRAGTYGGQSRRTYGVIGDDVNLAARLMANAPPGQVLVSERVLKTLEGSFEMQELAPLRVKGKEKLLTVARLIGKFEESGRAVSYGHPLVGRSGELARLTAFLAPITQGEPGGCTWVHGDAGIGKSHLIHSARKQFGDQIAWHGFATDQLVHESLHPVLPVLASFFNFDFAANDYMKKTLFDRRIDRLIKSLPDHPDAAAVAADLREGRWYIGALLGLHWNGSPYENSDPKLRFERSLNAVNTLAQVESLIKPLVLHVQDAQWLDPDSRALLDLWIDSAARYPLAILIDSRNAHDETFPARESFKTLPLGELDAAGVAELASIVLNGAMSKSAVRYLVEKANGNPFFTEQLALDLSERRALIPALDGTWDLSDQPIEDMPVTINAVLIARLDRLLAQVRTVVQIASVLGQEFEVPVLAQMIRDDPEVKLKVKQAEEETIWIGKTDLLYLFRHALLRDAAYSMQVQERLRELHALAGWAIEQVYADNLLPKSPDLAFHFEKSATYERAVIYLIKSAQHMTTLHANREAIGYYQRAIDLSEKTMLPPHEIVPIHEGLGDLYDVSGEYAQSAAHYDRALTLIPAEDSTWRTTLLRKKGQVLQKWGRYDEATQCFEEGLLELQGDLKPEEACQLYMGLSMINYRQGKLEDAAELATMGLMMAQMQTDQRNLAYATQTLGVIHWKKGEYTDALRLYDESVKLWQASQNTLGLAALYNNLGLLRQSMGDLDHAVTCFEACCTLFEQVGNLHGLAVAYDNLGQVYMQQGDETRAFECLEKAVTILARIGLSDTEVFTSMWQSGSW